MSHLKNDEVSNAAHVPSTSHDLIRQLHFVGLQVERCGLDVLLLKSQEFTQKSQQAF